MGGSVQKKKILSIIVFNDKINLKNQINYFSSWYDHRFYENN